MSVQPATKKQKTETQTPQQPSIPVPDASAYYLIENRRGAAAGPMA